MFAEQEKRQDKLKAEKARQNERLMKKLEEKKKDKIRYKWQFLFIIYEFYVSNNLSVPIYDLLFLYPPPIMLKFYVRHFAFF